MSKHLHAIEFDGTTFGMEIEVDTVAYRKFKSQVKYEKAISAFGTEIMEFTVPYLYLAAIMREAHWLVSERKDFNKFCIDGFKNGEFIYVKYTDVLDFRDRFDNLAKESDRGGR